MSRIIGIDLGTSNSAASIMEGGRPTVIPSAEGTSVGGKSFPSYVAFTKDGQLLVGEPARRQAVTNPDGTIKNVKRKMGSNEKVTALGKEYTPQQISAYILMKIKKDAEAVAESLKGVSLTIATKVSATGTIFGSVNNIQIADELAKLGHNIDRKIIVVKDNVKEVGKYVAVVKLHKEVSAEIPFEVVAEEA